MFLNFDFSIISSQTIIFSLTSSSPVNMPNKIPRYLRGILFGADEGTCLNIPSFQLKLHSGTSMENVNTHRVFTPIGSSPIHMPSKTPQLARGVLDGADERT